MVKIGNPHAHFYHGGAAPPSDSDLTTRLDQRVLQAAPPVLRRIIRENIGDVLRLQTAIESHLADYEAAEQMKLRLLVLRIFNMQELP